MLTNLRGKSLVINQIVVMFILVMLAGIGFYTLHTMQGSADQMGQGKDVVADILPPPLYLIEAQLVSYDLLQAGATERQPLIDKLHALKKITMIATFSGKAAVLMKVSRPASWGNNVHMPIYSGKRQW